MDPNAMVRALEKLLDYTASGVGAVAGPMLATWRARREAAALQIATQGQADSLRIIATAQAEAREALVSTASGVRGDVDIAETVRQRIQFQEEKRHHNIGSVVGQAAELLGDKEVPDQEPDHDWTARFFGEVQDVSSDEMRTLWAKILAGEVEKPGSTSARTLTILKNLDRRSASLFNTLCSVCVSIRPTGDFVLDARVPSMGGNPGQNCLQEYGLPFDSLNILNEYGLIISEYNSYYGYELSIGITIGAPEQGGLRIPFAFQNRFWVLEPAPEFRLGGEFRLSGVALTQAGRELQRVIDPKPNHQFLQDLSEFFARNNLRMREVPTDSPHTFRLNHETQ